MQDGESASKSTAAGPRTWQWCSSTVLLLLVCVIHACGRLRPATGECVEQNTTVFAGRPDTACGVDRPELLGYHLNRSLNARGERRACWMTATRLSVIWFPLIARRQSSANVWWGSQSRASGSLQACWDCTDRDVFRTDTVRQSGYTGCDISFSTTISRQNESFHQYVCTNYEYRSAQTFAMCRWMFLQLVGERILQCVYSLRYFCSAVAVSPLCGFDGFR